MKARCGGIVSLCSLVSLHSTLDTRTRLDALTSLDPPDRPENPPNVRKVSSTTRSDLHSFRERACVRYVRSCDFAETKLSPVCARASGVG